MPEVHHSTGVCVALSDCSADMPIAQNQEEILPMFKQTEWYHCLSVVISCTVLLSCPRWFFLGLLFIARWESQKHWGCWQSAAQLPQSALTPNFPNFSPIPQESVTWQRVWRWDSWLSSKVLELLRQPSDPITCCLSLSASLVASYSPFSSCSVSSSAYSSCYWCVMATVSDVLLVLFFFYPAAEPSLLGNMGWAQKTLMCLPKCLFEPMEERKKERQKEGSSHPRYSHILWLSSLLYSGYFSKL